MGLLAGTVEQDAQHPPQLAWGLEPPTLDEARLADAGRPEHGDEPGAPDGSVERYEILLAAEELARGHAPRCSTPRAEPRGWGSVLLLLSVIVLVEAERLRPALDQIGQRGTLLVREQRERVVGVLARDTHVLAQEHHLVGVEIVDGCGEVVAFEGVDQRLELF